MPDSRSENGLAFAISDVARLMRRRYQELTREEELGLNRSQSAVLIQLQRRSGRPINQARLAKMLEVEPMTLVPLLDHLQAAGLIERRPDPDDRRARLLFLTPAAEPVLARIHDIAKRLLVEATEGLPPERLQRMAEDLSAIKKNLDRALNDAEVRQLESEVGHG